MTPSMHLVSISRLLVTDGMRSLDVPCIEFLKPT